MISPKSPYDAQVIVHTSTQLDSKRCSNSEVELVLASQTWWIWCRMQHQKSDFASLRLILRTSLTLYLTWLLQKPMYASKFTSLPNLVTLTCSSGCEGTTLVKHISTWSNIYGLKSRVSLFQPILSAASVMKLKKNLPTQWAYLNLWGMIWLFCSITQCGRGRMLTVGWRIMYQRLWRKRGFTRWFNCSRKSNWKWMLRP